jgi:hypothetical protein
MLSTFARVNYPAPTAGVVADYSALDLLIAIDSRPGVAHRCSVRCYSAASAANLAVTTHMDGLDILVRMCAGQL